MSVMAKNPRFGFVAKKRAGRGAGILKRSTELARYQIRGLEQEIVAGAGCDDEATLRDPGDQGSTEGEKFGVELAGKQGHRQSHGREVRGEIGHLGEAHGAQGAR
jgi:hypothetical protein